MTVVGTVRLWWPDKGLGFVRVRPAGSNVDVRFEAGALVGAPVLVRGDRVLVTLHRAGRRYFAVAVEPEPLRGQP